MNATGKQYSGPTDRLYGAWSVASHVLDWTRVEQAIAHAALTKLRRCWISVSGTIGQ